VGKQLKGGGKGGLPLGVGKKRKLVSIYSVKKGTLHYLSGGVQGRLGGLVLGGERRAFPPRGKNERKKEKGVFKRL